jgi:hypothetical protein
MVVSVLGFGIDVWMVVESVLGWMLVCWNSCWGGWMDGNFI